MEHTESVGKMANLVCRAVSLALGVAVVTLGLLKVASVETQVALLGLGLLALALAALDKEAV